MAEETQEVEQNPLHDLVQHSLEQDYNKANKVFNDVISVKLNDVLDQASMKISGQIFNGEEPEDEENEDLDNDEQQLDLDLDNEEDGGDIDYEEELEDDIESEEDNEEK